MDVDKLVIRLAEILRAINDPHLQNLAECFLMDEPFMAKFSWRRRGPKTTTPITAACWSTS